MKTFCIALFLSFFSLYATASRSNNEKAEYFETKNIEIENVIDELFEKENLIVEEEKPELKVVILNSDFRKVRVGRVESIEKINSESTLTPVIYRSEFITKIHNVSYYMLKE